LAPAPTPFKAKKVWPSLRIFALFTNFYSEVPKKIMKDISQHNTLLKTSLS
jgi:hypothetical protein